MKKSMRLNNIIIPIDDKSVMMSPVNLLSIPNRYTASNLYSIVDWPCNIDFITDGPDISQINLADSTRYIGIKKLSHDNHVSFISRAKFHSRIV